MRRSAIGLALLAAVALPALAEDKPGGDDKLVGTWAIVTQASPEGTKTIPEGEASITLRADGRVVFRQKGDPDFMGIWRADPSRSPHSLDLITVTPGAKGPNTMKTIYRVDGDKLEVALPSTRSDEDRPKAFNPKDVGVLTLKRQKP
jgi:uncharacterized protein (TIGR03067 family)